MTALTKEEVIAQLQLALEKQSSETVNIVQKGSWYKINDGKSLRFSELEQMLTQASSGAVIAPVATKATKQASVKASTSSQKGTGMTPKELWRAKIAKVGGQAPRGC